MGSFESFLELKLTSADTVGAIAAIQKNGIILYDTMAEDDLVVVFRVRRKDLQTVQSIAVRRGERLEILKRHGLYWKMKRLLKRPVLVIGVLLLFFLSAFIPTRVFFVRVEGNDTIPTRLILEEAEKCGISFGASRSAVRSEKVKNALLDALPELKWAGVNTSGCVATITVRQREISQVQKTGTGVSNIVAIRDGFILSGTATKGNPMFVVGQSVKAGDVLISGYTDCGLSIRATEAVGEVFAQTNRKISVLAPKDYMVRNEKCAEIRKYALIIGKNRINFYKDSGILDSSCVKMSKIVQLTLPGGFTLPIYWVTETWEVYSAENAQQSSEETKAQISAYAEEYIVGQMIAGQILAKQEYFTDEDSLEVEFTCREMIGQVQTEEIITPNGERN